VAARDHVLGPAAAPITLLEYLDFECPFCAMALPEVAEVRRRFGDRLRFCVRHFPRPEHPHARRAAEASEAAAAQGRFWEMHDLLFANQQALEDSNLVGYAVQLGLDVERFERELAGDVYHDRVQEDVLSAIHRGAHGTPTFFVNGIRHEGRWDAESLFAAIAAAEQARPPSDLIPPPEVAKDEVNEASWESFPASDPPNWRQHK
jgi:protein-disulfide isomerase